MLGQSWGSQSTKKQHSSSDEFLCIHISRWKQVPIFEDQPWLSNYVLFSWLIFELHAPQSCSCSCSLLSWNVTLHQYRAWFALSVAKTCTAVCYVMHFDKFGCHTVAVQLFLNSFSSSDELQVWIPVQGACAWNWYIERGCVGKRQVTGDAHHQHQVLALHQCCNDGNLWLYLIVMWPGFVEFCCWHPPDMFWIQLVSPNITTPNYLWNFYREGGLWARGKQLKNLSTTSYFLHFTSLSVIGIFGCTNDHMTSFCWITWMSILRYSFYIQNVILCKLLVFSLKLSSLVRRTTWRHIHKERKKYWRPKWPPTNRSCRKFSWHKLLEMWRLEPGNLFMQTLVISQRPTPILLFV
jgi:hypothetical protein